MIAARKANLLAFSLIEMLVVISIVGVISSIAVPSIQRITDNADDITSLRIAQDLATTHVTALAAGHDFVASETNLETVIANIVAGASVNVPGETEVIYIGLPNLAGTEQLAAAQHLEIRDGRLFYNPTF